MKDPQNHIRSLALIASTVTVNPLIPICRYFRSGSEMLRMAKMYLDEGQLENAYILYTKYSTLFIEQIPKHPEYSTLTDKEKIETRKKLETIFDIAEKVKAALVVTYTKKYEKWQKEQEELLAQERAQMLKAIEEEERKMKERKLKEEYEQEMTRRIAQGREILKMPESIAPEEVSFIDSNVSSNTAGYSPYPTLNSSNIISNVDVQPTILPTVDRTTKPRSLLSLDAESEYVQCLRIVVVPSSGIEKFLELAKQNTERNVETCGILAGKMSHNQLIVTHLLIPKQTGTSDSCTTDNEEDVFLCQDKHELITLGWIHTHPSQTAFMSSVDLHTHCSYQLMMPEAIAIVCSPKYKNTCIFSLTSNYGLDYISQCQLKGFHPHPNEPVIYEESAHVRLDNHATINVVDLRK